MDRIILKNVSKEFVIDSLMKKGFLAKLLYLFKKKEKKNVLKNISLNVKEGEILGIIGKNGSGKSTLLRIIAGIYKADSGEVEVNGKIISLINLGAGLQERLSMRDNIYLVGSLCGLSYDEIRKSFNEIVNFSELNEFVNEKIYKFSNGMLQRLAFSIAIYCNPDILLLDEVFEVGDNEFKKKSSDWIKNFAKNKGSVILVSHDKGIVKKYCNRVLHFGDEK